MASVRFGGALAVLVAAALSSACAAATEADPAPDVREQIRQATGAGQASASPAVDEQEQHAKRVTEALVSCMTEAGFEFVSYRPPPPPRVSLGLSDAEFTRRYGWGISTLIDYQVPGAQNVDPNAAVRARLSPDAQRAYDAKLQACWRTAFDRAGPVPGPVLEPEASDELAEIQRRAEADPRVAEAKRRYADCMAQQGFHGDSGEAVQGDIHARVEQFRQRYTEQRDALVVAGKDVAGLRLADLLNAEELARLRSIQQQEVKAAVADLSCGAQLYPLVRQIHDEYIERYLEGSD